MRHALAVPLLPLLVLTGAAAAQEAPALILAGGIGVAAPLGDFADAGAKVGWAVDGSATLRLTRLLGVYGSYERAAFPVKESAVEPGDGTWVDSGLGVGAQFWVPARQQARLHPWLRLGVGWHDLDPLLTGGQFDAVDTKGIRTLEANAGVDVALGNPVVFLRPSIRYRRYGFTVTTDAAELKTSVSSITLSLGVALDFAHRVTASRRVGGR